MISYQQQVETAVQYLKSKLGSSPNILVISGTGLGQLPNEFKIEQQINYQNIPHFASPTVKSHSDILIYGTIGDKKVAVLSGRLHYYEGFSLKEITLPVRVMAELGCKTMVVTNAAGGLNSNFKAGDFMVINDHLNFMGENPLKGPNIESWGPRYPDMSSPYSSTIAQKVAKCAKKLGIKEIHSGVYVAVSGPSLETAAETRFLRNAGADAVGMSTVPEVIVARHGGMEVLGLSIIANCNDPDNFQPIIEKEVIDQIQKVEQSFNLLLWKTIKQI